MLYRILNGDTWDLVYAILMGRVSRRARDGKLEKAAVQKAALLGMFFLFFISPLLP